MRYYEPNKCPTSFRNPRADTRPRCVTPPLARQTPENLTRSTRASLAICPRSDEKPDCDVHNSPLSKSDVQNESGDQNIYTTLVGLDNSLRHSTHSTIYRGTGPNLWLDLSMSYI